ncbi:MAG: NADH-quinone oxidoreductase subunit NuoE [Candidatus Aminicenantes bacterium]|nr:NADH-quinone oxidoreductase subunit NuoE [Candidatus Aminicenantes bacterium]
MDIILKRYKTERKELIHILHEVQKEYGYIPVESVSAISKYLRISESEIFGILTFYKAFTLEPRGKHHITICMGTACHIRGAPKILEEVQRQLGIDAGETTPDRMFSLETVNCLGCCAIGPVAVIDGNYYSNITTKKINSIIKEYKKIE